MNRDTPLENVLRIGSPKDKLAHDERMVFLNVKKRQVIENPPWFGDYRTFIVSVDRWITYDAGTLLVGEGFDQDDGLKVQIRCRLMCPDGREAKLVEAVGFSNSPDMAFDQLVNRAARSFERQFDCDFFDIREAWQQSISEKLYGMCGLKVQVQLDVGEEALSPIKLDSELFSVYTEEDRTVSMQIGFNAEFVVKEGSRATAIRCLGSDDKLRKECIDAVRRWFPSNVPTLNYYYENAVDIEHEMRACLDTVAKSFGRTVGTFIPDLRKPAEIPAPSAYEYTHKSLIVDSPGEVQLRHRVWVEVQDVSKYLRAKISDLTLWTHSTIEQCSQETLQGQSYLDVAVAFDDELGKVIAKKISDSAQDIGCVVKNAVSCAEIEDRPKFEGVIPHQHSCTIREWPKKVPLEHKVHYKIVDKAKYRNSSVRDIASWMKQQLDEVTQEVLFLKSYLDVATDFKGIGESNGSLEDQIRSNVEARAKEIGLEVDQFSSVTKIETEELVNGFRIALYEKDFTTADSGEQVKLDIIINGRLPADLRPIRHLLEHRLHPDKPLKKQIENEVYNASQDVLNGIATDRYYCNFTGVQYSSQESLDEEGQNINQPVQMQIRQMIHQRLLDAFGIQPKTSQCTIKQADTKLMTWLLDIQAEEPRFDFNASPRDGDEMTWHVRYRIMNVVPGYWPRFLLSYRSTDVKEAIKRITTTASEAAEGILNRGWSRKDLETQTLEEKEGVKLLIFEGSEALGVDGLKKIVADQYGLEIQCVAFDRDDTQVELEDGKRAKTQRKRQLSIIEQAAEEDEKDYALVREKRRDFRDDPDSEDYQAWKDQQEEIEGDAGVISNLKSRSVASRLLPALSPEEQKYPSLKQYVNTSHRKSLALGEDKQHAVEDHQDEIESAPVATNRKPK